MGLFVVDSALVCDIIFSVKGLPVMLLQTEIEMFISIIPQIKNKRQIKQ